MPITEELMATGEWSVGLKPNTPREIRDILDVRGWGPGIFYVTPHRVSTVARTVDEIIGEAFYAGVHLSMTNNQRTIGGAGLPWFLGESDGGHIREGADATVGPLTHSNLIRNANGVGLVTPGTYTNGITEGSLHTASDPQTRTIRTQAGDTRRQLLDSICAIFNVEWKINPDGTLDTGTSTALFSKGNTVVLSRDGGRDGNLTSLRAEMTLDNVDLRGYATQVTVDWADGVNNGVATNTVPAAWTGITGSALVWHAHMDWQPRSISGGRNTLQRFLAYVTNSNAQATNMATAEAAKRNTYRINLQANLDEEHPHRFLEPGVYVYVYEPRLGVVGDGVYQVNHRGRLISPFTIRVTSMRTPCRGRYGYYIGHWLSGVHFLTDITEWIEPEEGTVSCNLGTQRRYHLGPPTGYRASAAALRRQAQAMLAAAGGSGGGGNRRPGRRG